MYDDEYVKVPEVKVIIWPLSKVTQIYEGHPNNSGTYVGTPLVSEKCYH